MAAIGAVLVATTPVGAQNASGPVRVSLAEGADLARQLLIAGNAIAAREIALALLQANPNDGEALLLLAQSNMRLGDGEDALTIARRAWRAAQTRRDRFNAAFTIADILASEESYTRSQLWVRRAIQSAPGPQTESIAIEAFRRVRQANPLAIELGFGVFPSSNVNSGNSNETINFAYLPGPFGEIQWIVPADERPLSGLEITLQTDLRYRIAETESSRTSLEFGVFGRTYMMSQDARDAAPDVTGESLSHVQASFGVLHQWFPTGTEIPFSANLTYTQSWAGGLPSQRGLNGTLGARFTLDENDNLAVSASIRYSNRIASDVDVMTYSVRGRWSHTLGNDDVFGLTGQLSRATSDVTDLAYRDTTVGVSYDFGPLSIGDQDLGLDLAASYTEQFRTYETSAYDPAGRDDRISSLRFDVGFRNIELYGFQPVMSLQANRTNSSVPRFDTEGAQIGFNLRSSF